MSLKTRNSKRALVYISLKQTFYPPKMERNPNQISPNLILGKISFASTFTANEMPSPFSFGHNPQQYSRPFLSMRWWWIILWSKAVLFSIKKFEGWGHPEWTLPKLIAFLHLPFSLALVYKAPVINRPFESSIQVPWEPDKGSAHSHNQNSIETSHLASSCLNSFNIPSLSSFLIPPQSTRPTL